MAYTKNTWNTGDIVSSQKLNHMEDGIANSENVFIVGGVTFDQDNNITGTLDKTWQEIHDALQNKICLVVISGSEGIAQMPVEQASVIDNTYHISIDGHDFWVSTASGYPARDDTDD